MVTVVAATAVADNPYGSGSGSRIATAVVTGSRMATAAVADNPSGSGSGSGSGSRVATAVVTDNQTGFGAGYRIATAVLTDNQPGFGAGYRIAAAAVDAEIVTEVVDADIKPVDKLMDLDSDMKPDIRFVYNNHRVRHYTQ